ncbi:MAG: hypothetical protein E6J90_16015 [Deltaproteobacteria bacterium]|nr:MAG: hypothetical protein E6J90_16015 [Deltaproteobacteria bacterium]
MSTAQHVLDQAYSLPRIEALAAEPGVYAERLAEELPSAATLTELEARHAALAGALGRIDAMIARAMRIRLNHAFAAITSIGARSEACSRRRSSATRAAVAARRASARRGRARQGGRSRRGRRGRDRCGARDPRPRRRLRTGERADPLADAAARDADRHGAIASSTTSSGRGGARCAASPRRSAPPDRGAGAAMAVRLAAHPA